MELYLSYAWNDPASPDVSFIQQLQRCIAAKGWTLRMDTNSVNYRDSVRDFMAAMGAGQHIIAVVSHQYLHSPYCMYEVKEMLKYPQWKQRVYPIVLDDADIFRGNGFDYTQHWQKELETHSAKVETLGSNYSSIPWLEQKKDLQDILDASGNFLRWLAEVCQLKAREHLDTGFRDLLGLLDQQQQPARTNGSPLKFSWPKVELKQLDFSQALRPDATLSLAQQLLIERRSINLIGHRDQGRRRMIDDLQNAGLSTQGIQPLYINMHHYVQSFAGFWEELCGQASSTGNRLSEVLERAAMSTGQGNLLILDNFEAILEEPKDLDPRYNTHFLNNLNALRNTPHTRLLLGSCRPHNDRGYQYQGRSSWLDLRLLPLEELSLAEIRAELSSKWSGAALSDNLLQLLSTQIFTELEQPLPLLEAVLRHTGHNWGDEEQALYYFKELKKKVVYG